MKTVVATIGSTVVAGGIFAAGMWTGGADLDRTKEIIDVIADKATELKDETSALEQENNELRAQIEELERKGNANKGLPAELEKANQELDKANKDAADLRNYAEEKLAEVEELTDEQ